MAKEQDESLIFHLSALRAMLIKCLSALGIGLLPMFLAAPYCLAGLTDIMAAGKPLSLNFFSPLEVFVLQIKTAVVLDILICFPYVARQVWHFILSALYENERKFVRSVVWVSSGLFIVGAGFCIFFILPLVIHFGLSFENSQIQAMFRISDIMGLSLQLSVVFGLVFQFPLVAYALVRSGFVSDKTVKEKRPYVFVVILILSAFLTPPDIISQLLLAVPAYVLFEAGLYYAGRKKSF